MRTLKMLLLLTLFIGFIMTMSCKKGDTGPAGAAGTDSVTYSKWISLSMTDEGTDTSTGYEVYDETITASAITSAILNKGAILTYLQGFDSNGDSVIISGSDALSQYFYVGSIYLSSLGTNYSSYNFRYVTVPATISVTSVSGEVKTYSAKELSSMSYKAVSGILSIPLK